MFSPRLGCSSISFRHQALPDALATIRAAGFEEIDLGALPGVCDHVPFVLDEATVNQISGTIRDAGLRVRSVNGDIGDLNAVLDDDQRGARMAHLQRLLQLTAAVGARALVLPCGALSHEPFRSLEEDLDLVAGELIRAGDEAARHGVELWTESLHFFRLCCNLDRARALTARLADSPVGVVMDFSHIVASGADPVEFVETFHDRIAHVHLRDADTGDIHLSIGRGEVDFAGGLTVLTAAGYRGHFALELETRDVTHDQRPKAAADAARFISSLL
ncbi:sugar phosphate isomerase/epimerase [Citricoccus sp.]|uniref:sugar phosphate isomerase/epimerase family protein n=1 Tax=Citricoccus sp. TaxID=1978372 RepID=UPI0026381CD4|nr:sugar phosphate isomerase/epimerase [Citricoccus sp.]HRO28787.1 sugar phosphate isomerase/epimerase [Citricoccus sp.]